MSVTGQRCGTLANPLRACQTSCLLQVQWNACHAAGVLLQSTEGCQAAADAGLLDTLVTRLSTSVRLHGNYKVSHKVEAWSAGEGQASESSFLYIYGVNR